MQIENNTLYYIYDPMCSWCYAYEQPLQALQQQLPAELHFKAILGGLAADTKTPMPIETQTMIQQAWRQIEDTVQNVQFNFDFWTKNTAYRSTYPACRAILAAAHQSTEFAEPMRRAIQQAYYQEAKKPSLHAVLIECAAQLALDITQFSRDLSSLAMDIQLTEHRHFSQQLGVSSFPSLRLVLNTKTYTIPIDYNATKPTLDTIKQRLKIHESNFTESPCTQECNLNEQGVCLGCFRLQNEIASWPYASETAKREILHHATQRKMIYNKTLI